MDKRLISLREEVAQLGRTGRLKHVVRYAGSKSDATAAAAAAGGGASNRAALSKSMLMTDDSESDSGSDSDSDNDSDDKTSGHASATTVARSGLATLGAACTERLKAIIGRDFPARSAPSPLQAEAAAHWSLVARLSRAYVARPSALRAIDDSLAGDCTTFFVTGESGIGKVSGFFFFFFGFDKVNLRALKSVARRRRRCSPIGCRRWRATHGGTGSTGFQSTGPYVLAHFASASAFASQLDATLRRLTQELSRAFGLDERGGDGLGGDDADSDEGASAADDDVGDELPGSSAFGTTIGGSSSRGSGDGGAIMRREELTTALAETLAAAASRAGAGIVLLVDGLEQLVEGDEVAAGGDPLGWLPRPLPLGVRVLVGARRVPEEWRAAPHAGEFAVPLLSATQSALLCARHLALFSKNAVGGTARQNRDERGYACAALCAHSGRRAALDGRL